MRIPVIASGTVALGGANVLLETVATSGNYYAYRIKSATFTCTSATGVHVSVQNGAAVSVLDAEVALSSPVHFGEGAHFQAGDTATLVTPAGSGTLAYTIVFELV